MPDDTTHPGFPIPYGYCQCGCGEPVKSPNRFVLYHHRRKSPVEYIVDHETGCWIWQRARLKCGGYGVKRIDGKLYRVHRLNYEAKYGPIPKGLVPHHRCENPACVNPDHLEIVTTARNIQLGKRAKLSPVWAVTIRELGAAGVKAKAIGDALEFHVGRLHKTTIQSVLNGTSWIIPDDTQDRCEALPPKIVVGDVEQTVLILQGER